MVMVMGSYFSVIKYSQVQNLLQKKKNTTVGRKKRNLGNEQKFKSTSRGQQR